MVTIVEKSSSPVSDPKSYFSFGAVTKRATQEGAGRTTSAGEQVYRGGQWVKKTGEGKVITTIKPPTQEGTGRTTSAGEQVYRGGKWVTTRPVSQTTTTRTPYTIGRSGGVWVGGKGYYNQSIVPGFGKTARELQMGVAEKGYAGASGKVVEIKTGLEYKPMPFEDKKPAQVVRENVWSYAQTGAEYTQKGFEVGGRLLASPIFLATTYKAKGRTPTGEEWEHYIKPYKQREKFQAEITQLNLKVKGYESEAGAYTQEVSKWKLGPPIPLPQSYYEPLVRKQEKLEIKRKTLQEKSQALKQRIGSYEQQQELEKFPQVNLPLGIGKVSVSQTLGSLSFFGITAPISVPAYLSERGVTGVSTGIKASKVPSTSGKWEVLEPFVIETGTTALVWGTGWAVSRAVSPRYTSVKYRDISTGKMIKITAPKNWAAKKLYFKEKAFYETHQPTSRGPYSIDVVDISTKWKPTKTLSQQGVRFKMETTTYAPKEMLLGKFLKPTKKWKVTKATQERTFIVEPSKTLATIKGQSVLTQSTKIQFSKGIARQYVSSGENMVREMTKGIRGEPYKVFGVEKGILITKGSKGKGLGYGVQEVTAYSPEYFGITQLKPVKTTYTPTKTGISFKIKGALTEFKIYQEVPQVNFKGMYPQNVERTLFISEQISLKGLAITKGKKTLSFATQKPFSIIKIRGDTTSSPIEMFKGVGGKSNIWDIYKKGSQSQKQVSKQVFIPQTLKIPKVSSITKTTTKMSVKETTKQGLIFAPSSFKELEDVDTQSIFSLKNLTISRGMVVVKGSGKIKTKETGILKIGTMQHQGIAELTKTTQLQRLKQPQLLGGGLILPRISVPSTTPFSQLPFLPTPLGFPLFKLGGFPSAYSGKELAPQPFKYQPSLKALVFKIKAPSKPKFSFTGLGVRPIIKTKSKRRKKK